MLTYDVRYLSNPHNNFFDSIFVNIGSTFSACSSSLFSNVNSFSAIKLCSNAVFVLKLLIFLKASTGTFGRTKNSFLRKVLDLYCFVVLMTWFSLERWLFFYKGQHIRVTPILIFICVNKCESEIALILPLTRQTCSLGTNTSFNILWWICIAFLTGTTIFPILNKMSIFISSKEQLLHRLVRPIRRIGRFVCA